MAFLNRTLQPDVAKAEHALTRQSVSFDMRRQFVSFDASASYTSASACQIPEGFPHYFVAVTANSNR